MRGEINWSLSSLCRASTLCRAPERSFAGADGGARAPAPLCCCRVHRVQARAHTSVLLSCLSVFASNINKYININARESSAFSVLSLCAHDFSSTGTLNNIAYSL